MADRRKAKPPKYRKHASGQAAVRIAYKDYYLGRYGTAESHDRYHALLAAWAKDGSPSTWRPPAEFDPRARRYGEFERGDSTDASSRPTLTAGALADKYLEHAKSYYRKNGKPTSEVHSTECALAFLIPIGEVPAGDFGPRALKRIRDAMVAAELARPTINQYVAR